MSGRLYADDSLSLYWFPEGHPLGIDRQGAFLREAQRRGLIARVQLGDSRQATRAEIRRFHTAVHVERVATAEQRGLELLDSGDTPVFPGVYRAAATVVGAALDGLARIMDGKCLRTFQPIGGLHHAGRGHAAGFCVFNDLGVVIETLRTTYGVKRVGYVDIDVHFGDGVFYAFEDDADLIFADIHQDGRTLYPGTGHEHETGKGAAAGTKLNIVFRPGAGDREFIETWPRVEAHLEKFAPEFIVFQCGADGLAGDPLASLEYSPAAHAHAANRLRALADRTAKGRIMAFGGGGYNRENIGNAWSEVLAALSG
jgi:acetoin utilization protein AcuC